MTPQDFIARWRGSGGAELANSQSFLKELCHILHVDDPEPTQADESKNTYVFEKAVEFNNGDGTTSVGRVDLYRLGCFVLESKQGAERKAEEQYRALASRTKSKKFRKGTAKRGTPGWEQAMMSARQQAKRYAEALPHEWPPFLIVTDVGHCFDLYADFSKSGKNYVPFPDPETYRIPLADLGDVAVRERLRAVWLEPLSLDPSRRSAKITRELAQQLAKLAKSLEVNNTAEVVAQFLMRCLFTMFAEDVQLGGIKKGDFTRFLESRRCKLDTFVPMLEQLWQEMNAGGFSVVLECRLKRFNGGLFSGQTALRVTEDQLELLIEAAEAEWDDVEPAIFGTLLERALNPIERHKLGAHYTPRTYVERLVMPALIEPLRAQWETAVYAPAVSLYEEGKTAEAISTVRRFHEQLCATRVLDPACGSGNFLYVSLELMKRLEGEVLKALRAFGDHQDVWLTIDPHQFLGIEVNPRAAAIADLVLWIGYLQWHLRTRTDDDLREPIVRNFLNIECRDAVLAWDAIDLLTDELGDPITRWDGRTTKPHPITGESVPDETARLRAVRYINPRKAEWPKTDYIVGNPPYLGARTSRLALGEGYLTALREVYEAVPDNVDYVMYWWHRAAELLQNDTVCRFGLITTKSIAQSFAQRLMNYHFALKAPLSFRFAIPNHPWVDDADGADVRVALTVCDSSDSAGVLATVERETTGEHGECEIELDTRVGRILPSLRIGAFVSGCETLRANGGVSSVGYQLTGRGFIVTPDELHRFISGGDERAAAVVHPLLSARDITQKERGLLAIDLFGRKIDNVRDQLPSVYQWIHDRVKPERDQNNRAAVRDKWWLYEECRSTFRPALDGLEQLIVTPLTSKFRHFLFAPSRTVCDSTTVMIASDDAYILGVLSSRVHLAWALVAGARLGVGNDPRYIKTKCFGPFPFPVPDAATEERIRSLGEKLDSHRKRKQKLHPELTLTGIYNVLDKVRAADPASPTRGSNSDADGELSVGSASGRSAVRCSPVSSLSKQDLEVYEKGLIAVLREIHDDLDAAVTGAYGWSLEIDDEELLQRLVDLNAERAAEEARGLVRWLRPNLQSPGGTPEILAGFGTSKGEASRGRFPAKIRKQPWPAALADRFSAVRAALVVHAAAANPAEIARYFNRARKLTVEEILDTLVQVGQARQTDDGRYVA